MSKAWQPRTFRTGSIVDVEDVNDNLRGLERDIRRSQDRRYTYCPVIIPLDGMVDTDPANVRTILMPPPLAGSGYRVEYVGFEVVLYAATGATWTLTATGTTGSASVAVATAGAAAEAYGASNAPVMTNDDENLTLILSSSAGNTIVRGYIVVHMRVDRFAQPGDARVDFVPALLSSTSTSAGSVIDTELAAAAAARASDSGAPTSVRCECYLIRKSSTTTTWRVPSGLKRGALDCRARLIEAGAATCIITVDAATSGVLGPGDDSNNFTQAADVDDPTDTTDDSVVTITPTGTVDLAYLFVWWS